MPMATKPDRVVTYYKELPILKSHSLLPECLWPQNLTGLSLTVWILAHKVKWHYDLVVLEDHVTNQNHYISLTKVPIGRMVTYIEGLLPIKSHDALIT